MLPLLPDLTPVDREAGDVGQEHRAILYDEKLASDGRVRKWWVELDAPLTVVDIIDSAQRSRPESPAPR